MNKFLCAVCGHMIHNDYMEQSEKLTGILQVCRYCMTMEIKRHNTPAPTPQYKVETHRRCEWVEEYEEITSSHTSNYYNYWCDYSLSSKQTRREIGGVRTIFKGGKPVSRV